MKSRLNCACSCLPSQLNSLKYCRSLPSDAVVLSQFANSDDVKYTRFSNGDTMLFDLTADPDELHELSHQDSAAVAAANERLVDALMLATDDARGAPVA